MKLISTVVVLCFVAAAAFAGDVTWGHSYDEALQQAKKDKKLVIVDVYTDWCGWCKKLDKDVYTDKDVQQKLNSSFVSVKINPEKSSRNAKLSKEFGETGFPHIVVVNADGQKIGELKGYVPAPKFLEFLQQFAEKALVK